MTFAVWGDEIAYNHITVGTITIPPTTLRDNMEADLLSIDSEAIEKQLIEAIEENRQEWSGKVDELEGENADLKIEVERLERALDAIDGGATVADLQAELAESSELVCKLAARVRELETPKPRKRRARL